MRAKRGFTLIELLVVVAIIALLIAILLPALGKVKETTRRTVCGTNLKSQGSAMAVYAAQFDDNLPAFSNAGGYWAHDEPNEFGESLLNVAHTSAASMSPGSIRKWFYCPSNTTANDDILWNYNGGGGGYRAMGYTYLNDRGAAGGTNNHYPVLPARAQPKLKYRGTMMDTPSPSDNELALDEILSPDNNGGTSQFNVAPPTNAVPAGTSHLNGKKPAGANVLAYDGHVAWRAFDSNKLLAIPNASNSFSWIINP